VRLASTTAILLDQPVSLTLTGATGSTSSSIELLSPGIVDDFGAGTTSFSAGLITLGSSASAASTLPPSGLGTLAFTAGQIDLGPGSVVLSGFSTTSLDAAAAVVGLGSGSLETGGGLSLLTPLITAASGAQTQVESAGSLTLAPSTQSVSGTKPGLESGGTLALAGNTIADSTGISMPSGEVSMTAVGALTISSGASINVAGMQPENAPQG